MSGFLPDLASWALRGVNNSNNNNSNENDASDVNNDHRSNTTGGSNNSSDPPLTAEEMRAQRLARMEALQHQQQQQEEEQQRELSKSLPMDVDPVVAPSSSTRAKSPLATAATAASTKTKTNVTPFPPAKSASTTAAAAAASESQQKKKAKNDSTSISSNDSDRKMQRKKELLLKKILLVTLRGGATDPSCVLLDMASPVISVQTIAEILASRLAMDPAFLQTTSPPQKPLMAYFGQAHRRAAEELKTLQQQQQAAKSKQNHQQAPNAELMDLLEELQRQLVSYAASCLMEPELFPAAEGAVLQLATCLTNSVTDLSSSITFGVNGSSTSSFYYLLCEELMQQDAADVLQRTVTEICQQFCHQLAKCESVLDGIDGAEGSAPVIVSALTALSLHKKTAELLATQETFLLPAAGTREAAILIRPSMPVTGNIFQMLAAQQPSYAKRSGPALEKHTILGMALRLGLPKSNAAFSPTSILRQSVDSVERTSRQQRQQLKIHQDACHQLVMALVKAGTDPRNQVMTWFGDALTVNVMAAGMTPDPSKVSSTNLLMNLTVELLKLCEPFVTDPRKHALIDPAFCSSPEHHRGVFATAGDAAVTRLGQNPIWLQYQPKNAFIPQCFFFAARSLHFSVVPALVFHERLLRQMSHHHWQLTQQAAGGHVDLQGDPHFAMMVSRQRSHEVGLFQDEMIEPALQFCNLIAKVLYEMTDDQLKTMPEDFVDDVCDILMRIARLKAKLLRHTDFRYVFKMVVKMLSEKYASMVRNYNLRAKLGDVLYEVFMPSLGDDDRRDVPASVATDPMAGGQTYLISDPEAQVILAPSLLLLYGEVEHTGYYDKMSHRAKISSLIKYLWDSAEHRPAFRLITQKKESFIKSANGIINETNTLIATVMQKLPEIRAAQEKMKNVQEWGRLSADEQKQITERLDESEREVRHALPLCNKTIQMFGYLNTDPEIRNLFLLDELRNRLVDMLAHVLTKLVGSKRLDLKVDNPESYEFRPKEMLRDLCAIFALFADSESFQIQCAKSQVSAQQLEYAAKKCRSLNLLKDEAMIAFESLPASVQAAAQHVAVDEAIFADAPDEFLDEILSTYMHDPVILPSGHYVDRSTITQHLLNDLIDPFNREPMTVNDIKSATDLKARMDQWLADKRSSTSGKKATTKNDFSGDEPMAE